MSAIRWVCPVLMSVAVVCGYSEEENATAAPSGGSEETVVTGRIDSVTVYRGEALVTRTVSIPGEAGLKELVVTDLPPQILPGSIFAEAGPGAAIRSIRYRIRPVAEDIREEVRSIDRRVLETQAKIDINTKLKAVVEQDRAFLKHLEDFTAPAATLEMSKGVLQPKTIEAVTKFLSDERQRLAQEEHRLEQEARELSDQMNLLQRERQTLTAGAANTIREAVVFVSSEQAGGEFRLHYLVNQATWEPSYNLRTTTSAEEVTVEYNASIQQSTGEDWTDVGILLSTATPSLVARPPTLSGIEIRLESVAEGSRRDAARQEERSQTRREIAQHLKMAEIARNRAAGPGPETANAPMGQSQTAGAPGQGFYDKSLNELAGNLQVLELDVSNRQSDSASPAASNEGISVTYELPSRITMPSRSDQQLVQIASMKVKGEMAKIATPLLTEYVYNEATLVNDSPLVLLAGPASSFVDGKFVGQGDVPTVAVGEKFAAGFGIDMSLRCRRESVQEVERAQGGNRVLELGFRLVVDNFGTEAAKVRLFDRMPTAKETEVKISLVDSDPELSDDAEYQASQRKKGILRWDIEAPPASIGSKGKSVSYSFRMEFDKNLRIGGAQMN